ncbi:hypothetical protein RHMOL_Rhmol06G0291700 [Rhododendron molle]|uniref:Uncharacterized protein n=1 Tax=Rhododendron molle TaxID=49168 RepID=A0ACC0NHC2_RHOML|nr:hypothetical protein RHMOL_Rhmol06G0291700 [Rhododendron molle]
MAKLTILAAALVAFLAIAEATRTTITTTVVEEDNPGQQQRCREQIQRQQNLRDCQRFLQQQARGGGGDDIAMITADVPNPRQQQLRQCCQQMENLNEQCRCEGVREAVRQQREQGEMQGEGMRQMMQEAENLPSRCNLSPRRCQIQASLY